MSRLRGQSRGGVLHSRGRSPKAEPRSATVALDVGVGMRCCFQIFGRLNRFREPWRNEVRTFIRNGDVSSITFEARDRLTLSAVIVCRRRDVEPLREWRTNDTTWPAKISKVLVNRDFLDTLPTKANS